mmetsp:Transcript_3008/g.8959  ORF Transcript_3008/g.8959 Transcript_3008/m.8959 type:complete len:385 (-) Transcript_3008:388-1542(-)
MRLQLHYKGQMTAVDIEPNASAHSLLEAAHKALALPPTEWKLKILCKGRQLRGEETIAAHGITDGGKLMVMASSVAAVERGQLARSDPTIRGFAAEDFEAAKRAAEGAAANDERSVWGETQHKEYKFCRFEPCTWQSFGTRPSSRTPHAFEARRLLLKLATDPAVVHIMAQRKYRVGTLAEMDPIDDRLAEKMEGGGSRLLGYNTNAGMSIHVRLRTMDLSGFEPYSALIDTLLHELVHNEVGPHNDHFWHLFGQLKADYLNHHASLAAKGVMFGGISGLELANVSEQVRDIRTTVLISIARDRMAPLPPVQQALIEGYLRVSAGASFPSPESAASEPSLQSSPTIDGAAETRALLADRAEKRRENAQVDGRAQGRDQSEENGG